MENLKKNKLIILIYELMLTFLFYIKSILYRNKVIIHSEKETIDLLKMSSVSLSRFGDGEMEIILGKDINFQKYDEKLASMLLDIISSNDNKKCIIGVIDVLNDMSNLNKKSRKFWIMNLARYYNEWINRMNLESEYYNANITRPFLRYSDKSLVQYRFQELRSLWNNKSILIVEGIFTRMGVGNDLFSNAYSVSRILCPNKNAFEKFNQIRSSIIENFENKLVILSLGPTATVLAYDLSKIGIRCLDLGHIDIEYDYYQLGMLDGGNISYKFVNEFENNLRIDDVSDDKYKKEIVKIIE